MGTTRARTAVLAGLAVLMVLAGTAPAAAQLGPQALVDVGSVTVVKNPTQTGTIAFPMVLTQRLSQPVTVQFTTQRGTSSDDNSNAIDGRDYVALVGTRQFSPGQLTPDEGPVVVQLLATDPYEDERQFGLQISQVLTGNAAPGVRVGRGTIVAATAPGAGPTVTVGNVGVVEGNSGTQTVEFPVRLSAASAEPVVISYRTSDGTAIAATGDYTAVGATTLTIPTGETETVIPVTVRGDTLPELNETFEVVLTSVTGAATSTARGQGVIRNDDGPHLSVSDVAVLEGADGEMPNMVFTVTLVQPAQSATVTVDFRTEDGTAQSAADEINAPDFVPRVGTLQFTPGQTQRNLTVQVVGDDWPEPTEDFSVLLSNAQTSAVNAGVTILKGRGLGTIINDDGPALEGDDVEVARPGQAPVTVEIPLELSGDARHVTGDYKVRYRTVDGTATADADYKPVSDVLTILRTASGGTISLEVLPKLPPGPTVAFTLELSRPDFAHLPRTAIAVTITGDPEADNAEAPTDDAVGGSTTPTLPRVAGKDRVATAVEISRRNWDKSDAAVLATSANYPDALAGGAVAAGLGAPMLLTPRDALALEVAAELSRLGVKMVWILGGPNAVSTAVEEDLKSRGFQTTRLAGKDRFGTAAAAARSVGLPPDGEVALALGAHEVEHRAWPDALSAGALAASPDQLPVLLTQGEQVPAETEQALAELGARKVVLLGGHAAISPEVEARVIALGYEVARLSGPNRFATSVAVAGNALSRWGPGKVPVVFATGENFPDGLAAGALAARLDGILVLVPKDALDPSVGAFLRDNLDRLSPGAVVGGSAAVSEAVHDELRAAMGAA